MGKRSRTKGARGERELANTLQALTGRPWRRSVGQCRKGGDMPDVEREDGATEAWVECKRGKAPSWRSALRQALEASDGRPPWVVTRDDQGEWVLHVRLSDLWSLAHVARDAMAERLRRAA